jgi:hypothetical protein
MAKVVVGTTGAVVMGANLSVTFVLGEEAIQLETIRVMQSPERTDIGFRIRK